MTHRSLRSVLAGRGFMLLPAAAYAVHEGRYRLGYGSQAAQALAAQGHGYLDSLAPWVASLLALAFGAFLARVARRAAGRGEAETGRSFSGLALLAWVSLVAIYVIQELLEAVFAAGHPGGIAGVFGHGGSWAILLAAVAALVVAAVLRASAAAVRAAAPRVSRRLALSAEPCARRPGPGFVAHRRSPLAGASAGRAPPGSWRAAVA